MLTTNDIGARIEIPAGHPLVKFDKPIVGTLLHLDEPGWPGAARIGFTTNEYHAYCRAGLVPSLPDNECCPNHTGRYPYAFILMVQRPWNDGLRVVEPAPIEDVSYARWEGIVESISDETIHPFLALDPPPRRRARRLPKNS